jgi:hypothetical protein
MCIFRILRHPFFPTFKKQRAQLDYRFSRGVGLGSSPSIAFTFLGCLPSHVFSLTACNLAHKNAFSDKTETTPESQS